MGKLITHVVGSVYLILRYKTWARAEQVRDEKYYGRYSTCGGIILLNIVAGTGAIVLILFLIIMIVGIIYGLLTEGPSSFNPTCE